MSARRSSRAPGRDLTAQVEALAEALDAGQGRLPQRVLDDADAVLAHARERAALSGEYTVVALAGATGSGKSSLLNAVAGADLAVPGVRRPTTGKALAAVWPAPAGEDPTEAPARTDAEDGAAHALLDWLEVDERHEVAGGAASPSGVTTGLVLLDLPDHDSVETEHRVRAERLYGRVDLLVWVVDPQKYADAALHVRYLRPLAGHASVVVLVLNHADRLTPDERERCLADLRRLAAEDGLRDVPVLAVSARTGDGVPDLQALLAEAARRREAATERVRADVRRCARELLAACGEAPTNRTAKQARAELVSALEEAAAVPTVVAAVRRSAARQARAATGWPATRWLARFRPDPLRRLGLGSGRSDEQRPDLARTSLPTPGPAARARAATAVRTYADAATAGAPDDWVLAARRRATTDGLPDALDQAVAGTRLEAERRPVWWGVLGVLQWLLFAALVAGLLWLALLAGGAYLQLPEPPTPVWWELPAPSVLAIGGALAGLLVALLGRVAGGVGAGRRATRVRRRLREAIDAVAGRLVVEPVTSELAALERCRDGARRAAR
ncbi:GTPase [Cellulomonas cellasea]|uniref:GTP-binding protein EngB required for normal cell division n=1 Tax=Cellulomonas cellasea TaxID=43670 RepID=A0A7W4UIR8_9CELL|nr:GTPase [Cellulomonas cellasea]MBB2924927.1 GTP-binding protein EngB required for normal cell division [Cellulomonas cellasea]